MKIKSSFAAVKMAAWMARIMLTCTTGFRLMREKLSARVRSFQKLIRLPKPSNWQRSETRATLTNADGGRDDAYRALALSCFQ